ncbi:MAG: hypothetical protein IJX94_01530 [Clostridia bacterium]|nr:hypothetical protein [Clostridia bacterium]
MQRNNDVIIKASEREAHAIADSPQAETIKDQIDISSLDEAETEFADLLKQIPDADLRHKFDMAVGRISFAYERLGFVQGYISNRLLNCNT